EPPIVREHLLVEAERFGVIAFCLCNSCANQRAAQHAGFAAHRALQVITCELEIARNACRLGELAVVMRDLARLLSGEYLELAPRFDGLGPLALALVDVH